jgi:hypothetical protein
MSNNEDSALPARNQFFNPQSNAETRPSLQPSNFTTLQPKRFTSINHIQHLFTVAQFSNFQFSNFSIFQF